jgi:hypothetical protein
MPLPADRAHDVPHQQSDLPQEPQQDSLSRRLTTLPDGHPSSPNDDDGAPRKPTVDLRDLELPVDDRVSSSRPADRTDSVERQELEVSDAWREQLPALQSLWDQHKERWPDREKPTADRSADEPGSWRSDSGLYLSAKDNEKAGDVFGRIRTAEQELTEVMEVVENETSGARLAGLENRLKGEDRCKEKIASDLQERLSQPVQDINEIAAKMHDVVRYTYLFPADQYARGQHQVRQNLEYRGYELVLSRDSWENSQYKGVNTRWATPDSVIFEVQFHTRESYEGKQLTHTAYERLRSGIATEAERPELREFQERVTACIAIPTDAHEFPDYRKEGY